MAERLSPSVERAVAVALASGLPYVGLRDRIPDPRLFAYVSLALARSDRVLPIALEDDRLLVVCDHADPRLDAVIEAFPSLRIDVAIAAREEIDRALAAVEAG
jgi:hypothetical protein